MEILTVEILNNTIRSWLLAAATAVAVMALFWLIRSVIIRRLERLARHTRTNIDDAILRMAYKVPRGIVILLALYAGSRWLTLPITAVPWINAAAFIIFLIQVGIWGSALINYWLARNQEYDTTGEATQATTLKAVSFVLKLVLFSILLLLGLDNLPGVEITTLIASLGIGGVAVALAVQNILGDLFASLSIALDKPFVLGDFIIVGEMKGTVEEIGLKTTRLRSLWGEKLIVSNSDLLSSRIQNYRDMPERRVAFNIGIAYETPPAQVAELPDMIEKIITAIAQTRFDRAHFSAFGNSALNFEIVYYVLDSDYNLYMDIQQQINLALLRQLNERDIQFAYPTQTVYLANAAQPDSGEQTAVSVQLHNQTNGHAP